MKNRYDSTSIWVPYAFWHLLQSLHGTAPIGRLCTRLDTEMVHNGMVPQRTLNLNAKPEGQWNLLQWSETSKQQSEHQRIDTVAVLPQARQLSMRHRYQPLQFQLFNQSASAQWHSERLQSFSWENARKILFSSFNTPTEMRIGSSHLFPSVLGAQGFAMSCTSFFNLTSGTS